MARPGSERATHRWLTRQTALGELIDEDFEVMGLAQLYRTSDWLWAGEPILQQRLFEQIRTLFDLECMVTLYDLTNTYVEGETTANPDAKRGHSKEKRSDCPLVTLGLVLDSSGFARKAKVFPGNAVECRTLQGMLDGLGAPADALVVMDSGVATAGNIAWLQESGRRYIVVSREQHRRDVDLDNAETLQTASNQQVFMDRVLDASGEELRLYCDSAVSDRFTCGQ